MKTIRLLLCGLSIIVLSSVLLFNSCGGSGTGSGNDQSLLPVSDVGVSFTADGSKFKHLVATVEEIQILNTVAGTACDVIAVPTKIDIADLAKVIQFANIAGCPEGTYNKIEIELDKSVQLMSASSGSTASLFSACSLTSYKDQGNVVHPLECSGPLCSFEIDGTIKVIESENNKLAIDFNLKDFDVANSGDPSTCAVTVKASHLDGMEMNARAHPEAIIGLVSDLTVTNRTFNLVRGAWSFPVDYSEIPAEQQPGLDALLQLALNYGLRVKVVSSKIGMANETINASAVFVKIEGISPNLNTMTSPLLLTINGNGSAETVAIDYNKADLNGMPADNGWVIVRLYGSDGTGYLASRIIVEPSGMSGDG